MSLTFAELLPAISTLSRTQKFQLMQFILTQLAQENTPTPTAPQPPSSQAYRSFDPADQKSLRGCLKQYAKPDLIGQEQDVWQTVVSDKYQNSVSKT